MLAMRRIANGVSTKRMSAVASAQRSSNNAAPGVPAGNVVNSFCTDVNAMVAASAAEAASQ
jgi:hypothetical protein